MASHTLNSLSYKLPQDLDDAVKASFQDWQRKGKARRLWQRDATLWTNTDEAKWLGWLDAVGASRAQTAQLAEFAAEVRRDGFTHIVLLGMGGSSLCAEVLAVTFGQQPGFPKLHVLDSTDPAQVKTLESKIHLATTLFIVASKSGSTLEPNIFKQYFFERAKQTVGSANAGKHFVAITDPGSKMQQVAERDGFRRIFFGEPSIGGRYSALSNFGMVPAAAMGLDATKFLDRAQVMVNACSADVPVEENPGVALGVLLGTLAQHGRDKMIIISSPGLYDLGAWLEQLVAESTGKEGKAIIPVDREPLISPDRYGSDRVFVYLRLNPTPDIAQDTAMQAFENAGLPVVRIGMLDNYNLGQEFFRWEIATAVAGSILGIHPFNQPDVEASKIETRKLTTAYESTGALPAEIPLYSKGEMRLFADSGNELALRAEVGADKSLVGFLRTHLLRIMPEGGDYFAVLAYLEMNEAHEALLQQVRRAVLDSRGVATCLGFGPRFLHSTGQAYKGGPNTGVFLQITCDDAADLAVPDQQYTFGVVKAAQARGDFEVLASRHRRALRVHIGKDVKAGLSALADAVRKALA